MHWLPVHNRSRNDSPEAIKHINLSLPLTISSELLKLEKPTSLIGFGSFAEYGGYTLDFILQSLFRLSPLLSTLLANHSY